MMMFGGGLMLIVGLLVMLLVFGLPILLVAVLAGGMAGFWQKQSRPASAVQNSMPKVQNSEAQPEKVEAKPASTCAHCGAGLQAGWTHCPQCGAPSQG